MKEYNQENFIKSLREIGLKKGDLVLVSTELFSLGRLAGAVNGEQYCQQIFDAIVEVIGRQEGTLVVNTYTTYTARYGIPYHHESSRPTTGLFSEFVLFHPESVRSLHPIDSVAAVGRFKEEICLNVGVSNYGLDSPVDRMSRLGGQVLRLGIDYGDNVFTHYVEALYGLPYFYNKLLDVDVFVNGQKTERQFFATVRHLELTMVDNYEPIRQALLERGQVYSAIVGDGKIHRVDIHDYCRTLLDLLKVDPWSLIKEPPNFIKGVKPYDGITMGRDGVESRANFIFKDLLGKKRGS